MRQGFSVNGMFRKLLRTFGVIQFKMHCQSTCPTVCVVILFLLKVKVQVDTELDEQGDRRATGRIEQKVEELNIKVWTTKKYINVPYNTFQGMEIV